MIIGIDASPAYRRAKTGIEWYAWRMTAGLSAMRSEGVEIRAYTDQPPVEQIPGVYPRVLSWPTRYFWSEIRLSAEMLAGPPDVLFVPARALPLALPKKSVTTIHDVGFLRFPEERKPLSSAYLALTSRRAAHRVTRIVTVSEFSKREIVELCGVDPEKILVTHLGYDAEKYLPATVPTGGAPYILCIGRRERRKNLIALVRAYEMLSEKLGTETPYLVLQGPPGHHAAEIDHAIAASSAQARIRVSDWLPETEKVRLLQGALCLVQPSLYEGFGLPVIEAQACGIPVVSSRAGSLPEVAGDAALFIDPSRPEDIADALTRIISDSSLRAALVAAGAGNCRRFSWEKTISQTLECLKNV